MYKIIYISLSITTLFLSCGQSDSTNRHYGYMSDDSSSKKVINSSEYIKEASGKAQFLYKNEDYTPFDKLQEQKLNVIEEPATLKVDSTLHPVMKGNQLYSYLEKRTLYLLTGYFTSRNPKMQMLGATAGIIHEDGVIITNYHVLSPRQEGVDFKAIFAADYQGNVFGVTAVLSASQSNDMAILKIDTKGKKLDVLPLANQEVLGEDIYIMGHPFDYTYFMTKGIVARKYISERTHEPRINVTAEFGRGSSGAPIVNTKGQLVAMVSGTRAYYAGGKKNGDLQLTMKEAIPVTTINSFIEK